MTEEDFNRLVKDGFTSEIKTELIKIKIRFKQLTEAGLKSSFALDQVQTEFAHLQYETIRKKVYLKPRAR